MGKIRQAVQHAVRHAAGNTRSALRKLEEKYPFIGDLGVGFWIFMLLIFILSIYSIFYIKALINLIVSDYGYLGILITSTITDMLVQPVGPDVPLIIGTISGVLNPWMVLIAVCLGSYLALYFSYLIGRSIGAAGIERIVGRKVYAKIDKYKFGGKWFMFIGALTPVPYIPYLAGLWQFNVRDVMIFVVFPRTLRFVIVFLALYFLGIILV